MEWPGYSTFLRAGTVPIVFFFVNLHPVCDPAAWEGVGLSSPEGAGGQPAPQHRP